MQTVCKVRSRPEKFSGPFFSAYIWDFSYSPQHHWSLSAFAVRHWGFTRRPHTLARGLKGFRDFCADSVWLRLPQACAQSSVININAFTGAEDMKTETRIGDWRITLNREDGHGLVSEVWRRR